MADVARLPGAVYGAWEWQLQARCRGMPESVFFHPWNERAESRVSRDQQAVAICNSCAVRRACRDYAIQVRERYGVWGGLTEQERYDLLPPLPPRTRKNPTSAADHDR